MRRILLHFVLVYCFSFASGATLFSVGKQFKYTYETLVTAGSEEPVSYASAYKLKGTLLVSADSSTTLQVKLQDLTVGLYNGPWSYFPIPEMNYFQSPDLAPLGQSFQITLENGKVKSILLDDQEPEWASNMKRGLATYLQMDLEGVNFNELSVFNRKELTTMGECMTKYEVLPSSTTLNRLTRVNKFRNHAECPDVPTRTRYATHIFYPCPDKDTRDIMNSTAYSMYEMEVSKDGQPLLKQLTLFSSVLYWPFTSSGPYQFSWLNMTLSLDSISRLENKAFPPPENAETFEDLSYVFEQSDPTNDAEDENTELTNEVLFFHHIAVDGDAETYRETVELLKGAIKETAESLVDTETFFENTKRFHKNSPFTLIPLVGSLDYEHLKQMFTQYNAASTSGSSKLTELQLFLDGLILAGTTPATLVIRDILQSSTDSGILTRLAPALPHYIRNPTEALAKEMDSLLTLVSKESIIPSIRRTITFSLASLIGRCCRKTNCTTSGLLDKYINYFEGKLSTGTDFEERTVGLLGLRNLRMGKSLDKVLDIAAGKLIYEAPLRIQAVWSLRSLVYQDRDRVMLNLLPVFYNRSESCELRTTVFGFLMSVGPEEKLLHDIAYFMWTETCPMLGNMVRSSLTNAMNTKSPCGNQLKSYARTILRYLPPGKVDPLKSSSYQIDYYDRNSGFGHQAYATVQKSGKTALPVSIYIGLNNFIGGYGSSYFGLFIRMEGVEKAIANKLATIRSTDVSKIKEILSKIGITSRPSAPLYLEMTVVYHDYTLLHYAVDERTLSNLPEYLKSLGSLTEAMMTNWERSVMLGGIFQEFPMEIGTPVSILAGVTGIGSIAHNTTKTNPPASTYSHETKFKLQFNLFGISRISNHAPSLATMHSMTTYRGLRTVVPRHFGLGTDMRNFAFNFFGIAASENDPMIAMVHGTGVTSLNYDSSNRVKDNLALELLHKSCSTCVPDAIVSRGLQFRKSRVLPLKLPSALQGMVGEVKYVDCERDHSRAAVLKKFSHFFREENQNAGIYDSPVAKLFLSLSHAKDYIFIAPHAETCGLYARIAQNASADIKLERIEGQIKGGITLRDSNGQENFTSFAAAKLDLKFGGLKPKVIQLKYKFETKERSVETQTVNIKMQANDEISGHHDVMCLKMDTSANRLPKDLLNYEGVNEPTAERRIKVSLGKVPKEESNKDDPPCLDNQATLEVTSLATRSPEQKAEAASNSYPYNVCKAEKGSRDYPGSFVPPSTACHAAASEQTNLRSVNVTIKYKIVEELETRWRRRANLISGLLYPYFSTAAEASHVHAGHAHGPGSLESGKKYFQGEINLDMNLKKDAPSLDVHVHDFTQNKEEHYHDIDLNLIPSFLRPRPVSSRMSLLWEIGFQTGIVSHCSVTPASVNTLDGLMYSAPLSDCWTLISGDCGTNSQFAILGKKISAEKIGILVHFGEHTVELGGDLNPIIDGKQVTLEDRIIYVSEKTTPLPFDVFKNVDEGYIISRALGIYVRYTGHFVTVTLGSRYRAVHCGLCGHWDSSFYNDLIGPDSSCPALLQPAEMTKAYVVNEGSCAKLGNQCSASTS